MAERELHAKGNIRFIQAVNDTQDVDVYVNRKLVVSKLSYQTACDPISLQTGSYAIDIISFEEPKIKLLSKIISIESEKSYTIAIVGKKETTNLLIFQNCPNVPEGEAKMRFLNLGMDVPTLDFAVRDRDVVFPNVSFQQITDYLGLTPMTVDLELRIADSKQVIFPLPKLKFKANEAYTLVLAGSEKALALLQIND